MRTPLKHRWSVSHNYLAGITAGDWWRLLCQNRFAIAPAYWHRAAFITLASLMNSYHWRSEQRCYGEAIEQVQITHPPLFILGHWRSGTTLLHYLLAQDVSQFNFANTYQVVNPRTFLSTEEMFTRRFAGLVPATRPMDNMSLSFGSPQEDEFAPLLLTLHSLYLGISFPRRLDDYARYLTFRNAPRNEIEQWQRAFEWFCKKLTLKNDKALILKSPAHTARFGSSWRCFPTRDSSTSIVILTACFNPSGTFSIRRLGTLTCRSRTWRQLMMAFSSVTRRCTTLTSTIAG